MNVHLYKTPKPQKRGMSTDHIISKLSFLLFIHVSILFQTCVWLKKSAYIVHIFRDEAEEDFELRSLLL